MSSNAMVIPLYTPEAIFKAWERIYRDIDVLLKYVDETDDQAAILNDALSGKCLIWLLFVDGVYIGFAITQFQMNMTDPPTQDLLVRGLYKVKGCKENFLEILDGKLVEFAKEQECRAIKFYSRRAVEKIATPLGFKPGLVEYKKEVV